MNFKHVMIVLKKELKGMFRDKRTWIASVLIPTMLFPAIFYLMGLGMDKVTKSVNTNVKIAVLADAGGKGLVERIKGDPVLEIVAVDHPTEALKEGKIKAIVVVENDFDQKLKDQRPAEIKIQYDEASTESTFALPMIRSVIEEYKDQVVLERLKEANINPAVLTPFALEVQAVEQKSNGMGVFMLSFLLPMLLVIYPVVGGIPISIDLASGEKERQSLEPLLSTSADRMSILLGKYITVTFASVLGVITSLLGLVIASKTSPEMLPSDISIGPINILVMVVVSLSVAMIISAILLVISVFARSYKEAGTYMSPLSIVLLIPVYLTMFTDIKTVSTKLFFVPILNSVLLVKEALFVIHPVHIAVTLGVSGVMIVISILFAKYMFEQEWVIFRS